MNTTRVALIFGLGIAGLLCGYAGNRLLGERTLPASSNPDAAETARTSRETAASPGGRPTKGTLPPPARIRSNDTLESLIEAGPVPSYGRLASWLMDATEPEIAAYWEGVKDKPRTNDITDLIFIHWTRLDPQAAIAAVAGTGTEHYAWWAWSCHDPEGALKAAIAANPDRVNNVAWGIGEFHPQWLLDHFDEIPESGRGNAISGLTKWDDTDRPLEILKFLKEHGAGFSPRIFSALVRKDPWQALDWMKENGDAIRRNYGSEENAMKTLVDTLADSRPDALERLASQTPSGELKRRMEAALFEKLLETDPGAALEQANNTKAPIIAAQRLAAVGLSRLKDDPDQALEIARKILANGLDDLSPRTVVLSPNGSYMSGGSVDPAVSGLVDALMDKDPAQVMDMLPNPSGKSPSDFVTLGLKWADRDLAGYSDWVNRQTDPAVREVATLPVVHELAQTERFAEAATWAMSSAIAKSQLSGLLYQWQRSAPDEAREWLESADLPAEEKDRYLRNLKATP
ncbi:MAG: hypothetical protein J0M04_23235 [Verrucomicrobia bacterium]|nr:hypothetical protein [Verrucomicrobiota bacterium]